MCSVQIDAYSVAFKATQSYEHAYELKIPIRYSKEQNARADRVLVVEFRVKSICPPSCGMFDAEFADRPVKLKNKKSDEKSARTQKYHEEQSAKTG
jgi:hypothetical protein